jgi:hypothetical protein
MRLNHLIGISALALCLTAGQGFAAEATPGATAAPKGADTQSTSNPSDPNAVVEKNKAGTDLGVAGVDIGKAGSTKESRTAYFSGLSADAQKGVRTRCTDAMNNMGSGKQSDILVFCKDVMPQ